MLSLIDFLNQLKTIHLCHCLQWFTKSSESFFVVFNCVCVRVYSRFGSLMEVYLVPGRNVGYIKYADRKPAQDAIALLHGKVINGIKMKVMLADPPKEESHKRQRTY